MIIPVLNVERIAYLGEMVRIDASKSIATPDVPAISTVSIKPEITEAAISCNDDKFLDFVYTTAGSKKITIVANGTSKDFDASLTVIDPDTLDLFSDDTDMIPFEPDVFSWMPKSWSKFTRLHKRAQDTIMDNIDERGFRKSDGTRYEAYDIYDFEEVQSWSVSLALAYLFEGLSNQVDDIFSKKALKYAELAKKLEDRASIRFVSDDGSNPDEKSLTVGRMFRG